MRIVGFDNKYSKAWDAYVKQSPAGTYYHLTAWKAAIEKTFGFKSSYLLALNDTEEIQGVLPLFLMKDIVGNKYLISSPSANYAGVCADNKEAGNALLKGAKELAAQNNVQYLELRQLADNSYDLPTRKNYVTMFLRLDGNEESVWQNRLDSKARNQVRKAYRAGLTVDFGREYLDDFYRVLSTNLRDLGTPVYTKIFFKRLLDEFDGSSDLIVVKHRNVVIGGMLVIYFNKIISDPWASSLKQFNHLCPNNILYWEAIKHACKNGFEYFDFGRSTIDSGTFKFKKQWGAEPVQLYYQYFLAGMQNIPSANMQKKTYRFALNTWKKLPLPVANSIGPWLNRYLVEL